MAWWDGLERGVCRVCGEPARNGKAFYCEEHTPAGSKKAAKSPAGPSADLPPAKEPADEPGGAYSSAAEDSGERRPSSPKATPEQQTLSSRLFGRKSPAGAPSSSSLSTGERRPASPNKRRVSTQDFWGGAVEAGSSLVGRAGYVPLARSMTWSSPVAGEIIEDATKGTPVDRVIQPLARNSEKWSDLFDLLGFWAAIGVAQANPAQADQALGFARKRLVSLLPRIAANIVKQRDKERQAVEAVALLIPDLGELFPDGHVPTGVDPVDALLSSLFAAPEAAEEPVGV